MTETNAHGPVAGRPSDVKGFLRRVPLLHRAPDTVVESIAGLMTQTTVRAGDLVCREGDAADQFFLIRSGAVAVTTTIGEHEHELTRLFAGDFLGEVSLLSTAERTATVRALDETDLLILDAPGFRQLVRDDPSVAAAVESAARSRTARSLRTTLEVTHRNLASLLERQPEISIGSAPDNDLIFLSPTVAEHHALLRRSGNAVELVDLASGADTLVNGERVRGSRELAEGAEVVIGDQRFFFDPDKPVAIVEPRGVRIDLDAIRQQAKRGKTLLHDISLSILPGELVAIVGASGAGKTTLLDAMAGLRNASSGTVLYNGEDFYEHIDDYRHLMGYVPQDDIIHRDLTLARTLRYAARLRLPRGTSEESITRAVSDRLEELGLSDRADLTVDKLSGGQRKRASIALELITRPRAFFLDEPTSGLDAATDRSMMELLRHLADDGPTVVLTTHATKNVKLCDKVIVLARDGHLAFFGPPDEALEYFGVDDFDEIYDTLAETDPPGWSTRFRASPAHDRIQSVLATPAEADDGGRAAHHRRSGGLRQFLYQIRVLSSRNFRLHVGRAQNIMPLLMQPVVISLLVLALFRANLLDPAKTTSPTGALQFIYIFVFVMFLFGLLFGAQEIVQETAIFRRERTVGVRVLPYVISKTTFLAPLLVLVACIMTVLFRITGRLPDVGTDVYLRLLITLILTDWAGMAMSLLTSAIVRTAQQATDLLTPWIAPQVLFAGGLFAVPSMNLAGRTLSNFTAVRWGFEAGSRIIEMKDLFALTPPIGQSLLIQYDASFTQGVSVYWLILGAFVLIPLTITTIVLDKKTRST